MEARKIKKTYQLKAPASPNSSPTINPVFALGNRTTETQLTSNTQTLCSPPLSWSLKSGRGFLNPRPTWPSWSGVQGRAFRRVCFVFSLQLSLRKFTKYCRSMSIPQRASFENERVVLSRRPSFEDERRGRSATPGTSQEGEEAPCSVDPPKAT